MQDQTFGLRGLLTHAISLSRLWHIAISMARDAIYGGSASMTGMPPVIKPISATVYASRLPRKWIHIP